METVSASWMKGAHLRQWCLRQLTSPNREIYRLCIAGPYLTVIESTTFAMFPVESTACTTKRSLLPTGKVTFAFSDPPLT